MKITKVLNEKVMVEVATNATKTESGLFLTGSQERKYEGKVVAVGTNPDIEKQGIKVGTYVFYSKGLNTELVQDDITYDIVSVYDLLAVGE